MAKHPPPEPAPEPPRHGRGRFVVTFAALEPVEVEAADRKGAVEAAMKALGVVGWESEPQVTEVT